MVISGTDIRKRIAQTLLRLRRDWAFTAAFVLTLALGIAANAAVFTVLDAHSLRPLPYSRGGRFVDLYFHSAKYPLPPGSAMSAAACQRLRSALALASSGLVSEWGGLMVAVRGEPDTNHHVAAAFGSALQTLDDRPLLGRWISRAADVGGPADVDIGDRLGRNAFHGDGPVLDRMFRVSAPPQPAVGLDGSRAGRARARAATAWQRFVAGSTVGHLLIMQVGAAILFMLAVASQLKLAVVCALRRRPALAIPVVLGAERMQVLSTALFESVSIVAFATLLAWPLGRFGADAIIGLCVGSKNTPFHLVR